MQTQLSLTKSRHLFTEQIKPELIGYKHRYALQVAFYSAELVLKLLASYVTYVIL